MWSMELKASTGIETYSSDSEWELDGGSPRDQEGGEGVNKGGTRTLCSEA